jgi:hypothetical protein
MKTFQQSFIVGQAEICFDFCSRSLSSLERDDSGGDDTEMSDVAGI